MKQFNLTDTRKSIMAGLAGLTWAGAVIVGHMASAPQETPQETPQEPPQGPPAVTEEGYYHIGHVYEDGCIDLLDIQEQKNYFYCPVEFE